MNRYNVEKTIKVKDKRGRLLDGFDKRTPEPMRTLFVEPGIKLRIPIDTETILNNFYRLNS